MLLRPLRTKESTNVALAFKNILHNGFVPEVVQSDAGSEFKGGPFQEICRRHGIKQKFGTAGKPNTQGGVERVNGTIKRAVFADFIQKNNTDFSRSLSEIQFCYNTTKHCTTLTIPITQFPDVGLTCWHILTTKVRHFTRTASATFDSRPDLPFLGIHLPPIARQTRILPPNR